jgi:hypothetical protein
VVFGLDQLIALAKKESTIKEKGCLGCGVVIDLVYELL